jgi:DNA-binding transcriptional LysR family regulator
VITVNSTESYHAACVAGLGIIRFTQVACARDLGCVSMFTLTKRLDPGSASRHREDSERSRRKPWRLVREKDLVTTRIFRIGLTCVED